jgi:hypothetical protein
VVKEYLSSGLLRGSLGELRGELLYLRWHEWGDTNGYLGDWRGVVLRRVGSFSFSLLISLSSVRSVDVSIVRFR